MEIFSPFTDIADYAVIEQQQPQTRTVIPPTLFDHVAPEVRLALVSVVGGLELLNNGTLGTLLPYQEKILSIAARDTQQLVLMLENMFTLSQIDAGRFVPVMEKVSLSEILGAAITSAKSMYDDSTIKWKFESSVESSFLLADAEHLQRAFANLIGNAAKFSQEKPRVEVTLQREYGRQVVSISDNGIGIPESELEYMGKDFFFSSRSNASLFHGAGIGFSVAQKIISMHEGETLVNSTDLGTLVVVQLPFLNE